MAEADDADETNGPMIPQDEADLANEAADATEAPTRPRPIKLTVRPTRPMWPNRPM